jgi:hypothetical protein
MSPLDVASVSLSLLLMTPGTQPPGQPGGAGASSPSTAPVFMTAEALKWTDLDPKGAPGVKIATLWGDHTRGAFGAYFRLPAGFAVPLHRHTHEMRVVFLSGTYIQSPDGKPEVRLGPGSYMLQPGGNYRHVTSCDKAADCVFFVDSDGPFDLEVIAAGQPGAVR